MIDWDMQAETKRMVQMRSSYGREHQFTCKGFLFLAGRKQYDDPWDYFDFADRVWLKEELRADLTAGVLPLGMILETPGFVPVVVMPDEQGQQVKAISEVL